MGQTPTSEDFLRQAGEYLQLAEGSSDETLRRQYLKIAGELTLLAAALETKSDSENSHSEGIAAPEQCETAEKRR